MSERKVIQICVAAYQGLAFIILCSDGTMWATDILTDENAWRQIPQPPKELERSDESEIQGDE